MAEPRLSAERVVVRRGGMTVIEDATFELSAGIWSLRGANGSGKSTLLRALAGVGALAGGVVRIAGHDLQREPVAARQGLGYAPQSADLLGYLGARELLELVAGLRRTAVEPAIQLATRWVAPDVEARRIDALSAGQRRKLYLCAALCGDPAVLLLDEPAAGLDAEAQAELGTELLARAHAGSAVLIAEHPTAPDRAANLSGVLEIVAGRLHPLPAVV